MMKSYWFRLDGDIITDAIEYEHHELIRVELPDQQLPPGINGGWYRWDGTSYHFDQELYDHWMSVIEEENNA
jgi:hypothetical protein